METVLKQVRHKGKVHCCLEQEGGSHGTKHRHPAGTAQKTAQKISNAIQAGTRRPDENGTSGQAASVTTFNYRNASIEQRNALKKRIREAAARGEKLYPGM